LITSANALFPNKYHEFGGTLFNPKQVESQEEMREGTHPAPNMDSLPRTAEVRQSMARVSRVCSNLRTQARISQLLLEPKWFDQEYSRRTDSFSRRVHCSLSTAFKPNEPG
jgi:hypothetical protein